MAIWSTCLPFLQTPTAPHPPSFSLPILNNPLPFTNYQSQSFSTCPSHSFTFLIRRRRTRLRTQTHSQSHSHHYSPFVAQSNFDDNAQPYSTNTPKNTNASNRTTNKSNTNSPPTNLYDFTQEYQQQNEEDDEDYNNDTNITLGDLGPPAEQISLSQLPLHPYSKLPLNTSKLSTVGAYAIRNPSRQLVYIGYSKNIANKLQFHQNSYKAGECCFYQVFVPSGDEERVTADELENVLESWVMENGGAVPRGNEVDAELWENLDNGNEIDDGNEGKVGSMNEKDDDGGFFKGSNYPNDRCYDDNYGSYNGNFGSYNDLHTPQTEADFYAQAAQRSRTRSRTNNPNNMNSSFYEDREFSDDPNDEYIDIDVDPFDAFSASRYNRRYQKRRNKKQNSFEFDDLDEDEEEGGWEWGGGGRGIWGGMKDKADWIPIAMVMGLGTLVWLYGLLSNVALPT